jgi:uncharacterized membrane protein
MNRAEFLAALERGLKRLPPRERAAILADYDAYFADGAAAGRPAQELADALGTPKLPDPDLRPCRLTRRRSRSLASAVTGASISRSSSSTATSSRGRSRATWGRRCATAHRRCR